MKNNLINFFVGSAYAVVVFSSLYYNLNWYLYFIVWGALGAYAFGAVITDKIIK